MSKLDNVILDLATVSIRQGFNMQGMQGPFYPTRVEDSRDTDVAKKQIKTLILDLFKEAEYEPYAFVDKVNEL